MTSVYDKTWYLNPQPQGTQSVEATDIEHLLNLIIVFKLMPGYNNIQQPHLRATLLIKAIFANIIYSINDYSWQFIILMEAGITA